MQHENRVGPHLPVRNRVHGSMKRHDIFERDAWTCCYCGEPFDAMDLTVDHVEPRVKGGDNSVGNLVTACRACNTRKAGLAAWAFLENRPEERANFLRLAVHVWPRLRRAIVEAAGS